MDVMVSVSRVNRAISMVLCCGLLGVWLSGCLIAPGDFDESLLRRYQKAIVDRSPQRRAGERGPGVLRPLPGGARAPLKIVDDPVTGEKAIELSLAQAIAMAMAGSPQIRVVSFDPAILHEDVVAAAAAFDLVVFGGINQSWVDRNQASTFLGGQTNTTAVEAGVRNMNTFGGLTEVKLTGTRTSDDSAFTALSPRYESELSVEVTQPLLRGGGQDFNLAALRLTRVGRSIGEVQFRQRVEEIVVQVEQVYRTLAQARGFLAIQQRILNDGEETLRKVRARGELDARSKIEVKQTEVAVEQRRAEVVRFRKTVGDAEDALARLLSDPRLNVLSDCRICPADAELEAAVFIVDPMDQLINALRHNPQLEQARLAIDAAAINVTVARNETLPVLNLTASIGLQGLDGSPGNAFEEMRFNDFISYGVGLAFEYPWGNRAAEARLRRRQLERRKAVEVMQDVADQVAVAVNEAIRQIQTSYDEAAAQRKVVDALEKNLEGLEALLELGRQSYLSLLQLILQQQDALGFARRAELQAIINFRNAQSRLTQLTGTVLHRHQIRLMAEDVSGGWAPPLRPPTTAPATLPATLPAATLPTTSATLPAAAK